ncbi:Na+/H+ antiporter NhaA [Novosphingobium sp. 9]|uniref:Na+/H+ antiporter NhaA n=1 Tax=Novosphingobium sp. 9 TaxID=2025349 RepID=UPI0021B5AFB2|nr:Na+/H+ antiporter NhaA [Novosphingobium sp. 9]
MSPLTRAFLKRVEPFFAGDEIAGGPMLLATIAALVLSTSPWGAAWKAAWDLPLQIGLGPHVVSQSLAQWVDDALLPIFFVIIGADLKREVVNGALAHWRTAAFPVSGALGGMLVPVGLFLLMTRHTEAASGWGAVMVTDTAFGLALLGMFAGRFPPGMRALLLAFAAVDDLGGLIVIAGVYTQQLILLGLIAAGVAYLAMIVLRRARWIGSMPYIVLALVVWAGVFVSGVHATIAGVFLGFITSSKPRLAEGVFAGKIQGQIDRFQDEYKRMEKAQDDPHAYRRERHDVQSRLGYLSEMALATDVPGERVVSVLTPWVSYIVLPLFVLSNVHVPMTLSALGEAFSGTLAPAILLALVLGKPLGFLLATGLATSLRLARRPEGVTWIMVATIGLLAGIGFTISLFIADLAFDGSDLSHQASIGVIGASVLAGLLGLVALHFVSRRES